MRYNTNVMQVLNVTNLKVEFGDYVLFDNVTFSLNDKDRLALIGPNGMGKSTIIKVILNQIDKTSGDIAFLKGLTIGYLSQEVISDVNHTLKEEVLEVFSSLIKEEEELKLLEEQISLQPDNQKLIDLYGKKQNEFIEKGGYDYHYLIPDAFKIWFP